MSTADIVPSVADGAAYSVRMHASQQGRHVSGAERLVERPQIEDAAAALLRRALFHAAAGDAGPDEIKISVSRLQQRALTLQALPVSCLELSDHQAARAALSRELRALSLEPEELLTLLYELPALRGAVLYDINRHVRVEPDTERGVRVRFLDYFPRSDTEGKCHFHEALCLATKVASCPFIAGELCISDDPGYTTGYFASASRGYLRMPHLKDLNHQGGGRVFLFAGESGDLKTTLDYLERRSVLVDLSAVTKEGAGEGLHLS